MSIQDNNGPKKDSGKLRKIIRKKVVAILKNKTDAKNRVFPNAVVPPWEEELPVILIYPRSEGAGKYAEAPRELERDLDLAIEIIAAGPGPDEDGNAPVDENGNPKKSLEDILDDIAEQVECEMSRDETLGGTADDSILKNTESEFENTGGQPIGSARLTYGVTYYTMSPRSVDKQIGLPDFKEAGLDWHIGDEDDTVEAEDIIDIPIT